jgi:SAM-dependent methyltransferase
MAHAVAYNSWLLERAQPWLHGRVLDVGAGIGTHTLRIRELADEVVAVEPDAALAALLRLRAPGVTVVEGDAAAVDRPFDAIVCFNVLEHIRDDVAALARFGELLAPAGALLLLVPAHPALYGTLDRTFGHERRYRRSELESKLSSVGLRPEVLRHVNAIGAAGWLVQSRVLRRPHLPHIGLSLYDRVVPIIRTLDRIPLPLGLSLWAVARKGIRASGPLEAPRTTIDEQSA